MATTKAQRWGILAVMIIMVVGTLGSFAVMILSQKNETNDAARQQKLYSEYQEKQKAYQTKVDAQAAQLSEKYFATFSPYASRVSEFNRDDVKELQTEDLVVGDGEEITDQTKFAAYYIGWNPKAKVFDQSIADGKLKAPISIETGLANASLIAGWKEGMKGMRINGVRELTIPSDKAYGEKAQGDEIPANTPLKFVVMAVAAPEPIPQPEMSPELLQSLGGAY